MDDAENHFARSFVNAVARAFDVGASASQTRLALVPFNADVQQSSSFSVARATSAADFAQHVRTFPFTRVICPTCTNTAAAIASATSIIQAGPVVGGRTPKTVALILTDGDPNNKGDCGGNQTPLACTRTKFTALKAVAQTTIYVRIGNDASKTLFNKQETSRIDATFSTLAQKVQAVLDKICDETNR